MYSLLSEKLWQEALLYMKKVPMSSNPIGVIDSGFGGLSVLRYLLSDLPNEDFVYIADSGFCPYGRRSFDEIRQRVFSIVDFLISEHNVKLVVVACNTATAAAIDSLREKYSIPFVGMEPAIKPAALSSTSKVVGVLATEGTFNGRLFKQTCEKFATDVKVVVRAGNGLVELIEDGKTEGEEVDSLLSDYLTPMVEENVDLLVLGCTHFPFLQPAIEHKFPNLRIIDPAPAISRQTNKILMVNELNTEKKTGKCHFFTSGLTEKLDAFVEKMLGIKIKSRQISL